MLHDPRHDKTPSLAGFGLFVASKDPTERYNWFKWHMCPTGQYLQSIGQYNQIGQEEYTQNWNGLIADMNLLARGHLGACARVDYVDPNEWTFGRLADRVLAYQKGDLDLADSPIVSSSIKWMIWYWHARRYMRYWP